MVSSRVTKLCDRVACSAKGARSTGLSLSSGSLLHTSVRSHNRPKRSRHAPRLRSGTNSRRKLRNWVCLSANAQGRQRLHFGIWPPWCNPRFDLAFPSGHLLVHISSSSSCLVCHSYVLVSTSHLIARLASRTQLHCAAAARAAFTTVSTRLAGAPTGPVVRTPCGSRLQGLQKLAFVPALMGGLKVCSPALLAALSYAWLRTCTPAPTKYAGPALFACFGSLIAGPAPCSRPSRQAQRWSTAAATPRRRATLPQTRLRPYLRRPSRHGALWGAPASYLLPRRVLACSTVRGPFAGRVGREAGTFDDQGEVCR